MTLDGADTTVAPIVGVGRVLWADASTADAASAGRDRSLPVLREAWTGLTVSRQSVIVRQVGGKLASWIVPVADREPTSVLDIVVLDAAASLLARDSWRVPEMACLFRIVIGDPQLLGSDAVWRRLPRADIAVSAAARDLDSLARCFIEVMATEGLIGIDTRDVLDVAGCRGSRVARGRAIVVPGQGILAGHQVRDALSAMARETALGGVLLYQSVSPEKTTPHVLVEIDAMATAAVEGLDLPVMLAGMYDRSRTEVVAIAFDKIV